MFQEAGTHIDTYSTCIPTGNNEIEDTINGFLLNLDRSVDVFAAKVCLVMAEDFASESQLEGSQRYKFARRIQCIRPISGKPHH